jgi:hypothetical protein
MPPPSRKKNRYVYFINIKIHFWEDEENALLHAGDDVERER